MKSIDLKALDAEDTLNSLKKEFYQPDGVIYLDGNSLGMMPRIAAQRVQEVTRQQWGHDLITSWNKHQWIDLPQKVGDRIGGLIGAAPGQTVCCDSISVNLFKVLASALRLRPGKTKIVSTEDNFPTDLYMVQGLEALLGESQCHLKLVNEAELAQAIDEQTVAVLVTEVNFRTGRRLDIEELCAAAHNAGALCIVDLAHSTGVLPVALDNWQVDFAVGCTYKYLNGGPGAPAFVYAAKRHQHAMQQPLYGWMGHSNGFTFSPQYQPADSIQQMLVGTPAIIAMSAVDAALDVYDKTSISAIRQKSMKMTEVFLKLLALSAPCRELRCISPQAAEERGSQLSFEFDHAWGVCQALIKSDIIADFRAPCYLRFGFSPLYNSFQQLGEVVSELEQIMHEKRYLKPEFQTRHKVT
ncbi:kynureninase [Planctobacterium marinum]